MNAFEKQWQEYVCEAFENRYISVLITKHVMIST